MKRNNKKKKPISEHGISTVTGEDMATVQQTRHTFLLQPGLTQVRLLPDGTVQTKHMGVEDHTE